MAKAAAELRGFLLSARGRADLPLLLALNFTPCGVVRTHPLPQTLDFLWVGERWFADSRIGRS